MADIQWLRHINKLCEHQGGARYDDMLIGCIGHFDKKRECTPKQGDWLIRQLAMHYGIKLAHTGAIALTKEQRRTVTTAVDAALAFASPDRLPVLQKHFPHRSHRKTTPFPHGFHTKGANSAFNPTSCHPSITRLLLKLIDWHSPTTWPLASTDTASPEVANGSSRNQIGQGPIPKAANFNGADDAASPLRGCAAKSDEPLGQGESQRANQVLRQMKAKASNANISLWANGNGRSYMRGVLEVGGQRYRLNFRPPRRAEELIYVPPDGDTEARAWFEQVSSRVIPKFQAQAEKAEGRLARNHVVSAIHRNTDKNCSADGIHSGIAVMLYDGNVPTTCIVQLDGLEWHFGLMVCDSKSPNAPQFKASAGQIDKAA
jgi:hypothetical protein